MDIPGGSMNKAASASCRSSITTSDPRNTRSTVQQIVRQLIHYLITTFQHWPAVAVPSQWRVWRAHSLDVGNAAMCLSGLQRRRWYGFLSLVSYHSQMSCSSNLLSFISRDTASEERARLPSIHQRSHSRERWTPKSTPGL